jgi:uncharacterized membrane protein
MKNRFWSRLRQFASQERAVLLLVGGYTLLFFLLASRHYAVMNSSTTDGTAMVEGAWHTLHGRIIADDGTGVVQVPWYALRNRLIYVAAFKQSVLANHAWLLMLWVVPLYWLVPSGYTWIFAQSLSIGASGIPFYFLARKVLGNNRAAALITTAYLFYPTVVTSHVNQVHVECFALPFLMTAAYCFFERRLVLFLVFSLLGMLAQENVSFTIAAFGIYAAIKRRNIRWVVFPILMGVIYDVIVFKALLPYFGGGKPIYGWQYHPLLGDRTMDEFIKTALTQPWRLAADMLDRDHIMYAVLMLQPLLWIVPLLVPELLLAIPAFGLNMVMDSSYRVIAWHFAPTLGAFLCVAAIFGIRRLAMMLEARWRLAQPQVMLGFCMCALSVASWSLWLSVGEFFPQAYQPTLQKAVELASNGRSVLAPSTLSMHLADREAPLHMDCFNQPPPWVGWRTEQLYTLDYIILDGNERRFQKQLVTRELFMSFYTNVNYQLILNENNVYVFQRRSALHEPLTPTSPAE